jgi:hypothetical protein
MKIEKEILKNYIKIFKVNNKYNCHLKIGAQTFAFGRVDTKTEAKWYASQLAKALETLVISTLFNLLK